MSSALFGILQLDRGEPLGLANVSGLVQAWLQDAGGFGQDLGLDVFGHVLPSPIGAAGGGAKLSQPDLLIAVVVVGHDLVHGGNLAPGIERAGAGRVP